MGVLTSLGQGQAENWRALTGGVSGIHRITRFPIGGMRTTIAGTVDFIPVDGTFGPRVIASASPNWWSRKRWPEVRHRPPRRLPGPAVHGAAAGGDGVAATPRPGRGVRRSTTAVSYDDLLRAADNGAFRAVVRALPVRLRRRGIWRSGSAPKARRSPPRPPAPPAAPRSNSASRRSAAASARRRWCVGTDASVNPESLIRFSLLSALSTRNDPPRPPRARSARTATAS